MNRRTLLSSIGAGLAAATIPSTSQSVEATNKHLDVSIFMTDAVQTATATADDPHFATNLIGHALERTLETLPSDDQRLTYTIRTETKTIDADAIDPEPDNPVDSWESHIGENVPADERGADTNLLLTNKTANLAGQANHPCDNGPRCDSPAATAAIVMNAADHITQLTDAAAAGPWDLTTSEYLLPVAVHEIGHTIDLTHAHGTGSNGSPPEVTVMLGTYIFNDSYAGAENRYNQQLPDMDGTETALCRAAFNSKIDLNDITTTSN